MGAIEIYCNNMGCDIEGLAMIDDPNPGINTMKAITTLVLSAVQNGCELNRVPFDISYRDLQVALEEMEQDDFKAIMENFAKSKYLGRTIQEYFAASIEPDDKKKAS